MSIKSGQSAAGGFVTVDGTGAITAATGDPVGVLYVNGVANGAAVTVTGANPYKWACTLPSLSAGDIVQMYITATVDGISTAGWVWAEVADTKRISDLNDAAAAPSASTVASQVRTELTTELGRIDATISSRTKPADTQAAVTLVTTTTNLTNLPAAAALEATAQSILADTNELQTDWHDGGRLDLLLDGVDAEIWSYSSRTLTQSAASVTSTVAGSTITITRGDVLSRSLTNIGALTGYISLDFTIKESKDDTDADAILRIRKNASGTGSGLLRVNKAAATAGDGSITIDDELTGDITIALVATVTDDLAPRNGLYYDIQVITAAGPTTLSDGTCNISADVTRAVS